MIDDLDDSLEPTDFIGFCRWTDCDDDATTVLTRLANKEEQDDGCITWENGFRVPLTYEMPVCDRHLAQAQRWMHLQSLSNQELLQSWADDWRALMHAHRDSENTENARTRYDETTDQVVMRGLGTKDKPPIYGTPTIPEDIHSLTDKEVFHRAWRVSLRSTIAYALTFVVTWVVGQFYLTGAKYLTYLFLVGLLVATVMALFVVGTTLLLLTSRLFTKKAPRQSRYDLGLAGVRLVELAIIFSFGWFLFVRFVR